MNASFVDKLFEIMICENSHVRIKVTKNDILSEFFKHKYQEYKLFLEHLRKENYFLT